MAKSVTKSSPQRPAKAASGSSPEGKSPRKLKKPVYKSFSLQKRIKPETRLPSSWRLLRSALGVLRRNWKLFLGILVVYAVLNAALVEGFSGTGDPTAAKAALNQALNGHFGQLASGASAFVYLLGNSTTNLSPSSGSYQFLLTTMVSLALIWTLREVYAGHKVRIRDSYYRGMYPLVPFLLVFLAILVQCVPFAIGAYLYSTVTTNGIAATSVEMILWGIVFLLLAVMTLYMVSSSIIALYVAALPDMSPMNALAGARALVRYRRWEVLRKVLFVPVALVVLAGLIIIPCILLLTPLSQFVFFVVTTAAVAVLHSYMYALYRSLL